MTQSARPNDWWSPWGLEVAHIASGGGDARRVDDRRAVGVLCSLAHRCHVSNSGRHKKMTINGVEYDCFDSRHMLYLKQRFDVRYYDRGFLSTVWIGSVPEPVRPPESWMEMLFKNQGILL